jgi:hypothetical protein
MPGPNGRSDSPGIGAANQVFPAVTVRIHRNTESKGAVFRTTPQGDGCSRPSPSASEGEALRMIVAVGRSQSRSLHTLHDGLHAEYFVQQQNGGPQVADCVQGWRFP